MLLKSVTITNFGSMRGTHGPIRLDGRGLCAITGENLDDPRSGSNGAGKSTIFDAIDWCLFGKPPRGGKVSSVMNDVVKKNCEVEIVFECEKGEATATRRMKCAPEGLTLGGVAAADTALDTTRTQSRLEEYLGFDREVFHAAVLFAQNDNLKFAEQTDAKRKELLTKMLPELAVVDLWLDNAKVLHRNIEQARGKATLETQRRAHRLENILAASPEALFAQWEGQQGANIQAATAHEHAEAAKYTQTQTQVEVAKAALPPEPVYQPGNAQEQLERAQAALSERQQLLEQRNHARAVHEAALSSLERHDAQAAHSTTCPTCRQDLPVGQHIPLTDEQVMSQARDLVTASRQGASAIQAEITTLRSRMEEASMAAYREKDAHKSLVEAHARAVTYYQQTEFQMRQTYATYREAVLRREAAVSQTNPYTDQVAKWKNDVEEARKAVPEAERVEAGIAEREELLAWWVKALGAKGVKSHLLDLYVSALTDEVNKWVQLLTGNICWVQFDTTTTVGKGSNTRQSDKFTIRIYRHNTDGTITEREFSQWSGGEKHRLAVAIDFGWSRLIATRAGADCAQLFLDEVFQKSLDQEGRLAMGELLKAIAPSKSSVFVVDHDSRFMGLFEDVIQVEKQDGTTTIKKGAQ